MPNSPRRSKSTKKSAAKIPPAPAPLKKLEEVYDLPEAIRRANDIFIRNVGTDDKLALDAVKEMNRLHDLYRKNQEALVAGQTAEDHPAHQELAAIEAHLRPLGLADDDASLSELARLAAMIVMTAKP